MTAICVVAVTPYSGVVADLVVLPLCKPLYNSFTTPANNSTLTFLLTKLISSTMAMNCESFIDKAVIISGFPSN